MAQTHDAVWWKEQFGGKFLVGKQKQRPAKTEAEAREFVAFYEKRGGGSAHWKLAMQREFTAAYGKPYMKPEDYRVYLLEHKAAELERQIAEKQAQIDSAASKATNVVGENKTEEKETPGESIGVYFESDVPPLTKAQFKERFCKNRGYGSGVPLTPAENLQFGKAWKKYPSRIEE
jgi:hypothetical protein